MRAGGRTLPVARSGLKQGRRCSAGREGTPVLTVVQDESSGEEPGRPGSLIDEIVREGARRMLAATVRHRTKVTKGPGSRAAGLAMAFKLIESAQERWRAVNAPQIGRASCRERV